VIGAAIEVHRQLGPGFLDHVYEEAMAIELAERRIPVQRQLTFPVYYKRVLVAESRLDLLVAERLVVELKAVEELRPIHTAGTVPFECVLAFLAGLASWRSILGAFRLPNRSVAAMAQPVRFTAAMS
jgi:GxxExxY protein